MWSTGGYYFPPNAAGTLVPIPDREIVAEIKFPKAPSDCEVEAYVRRALAFSIAEMWDTLYAVATGADPRQFSDDPEEVERLREQGERYWQAISGG